MKIILSLLAAGLLAVSYTAGAAEEAKEQATEIVAPKTVAAKLAKVTATIEAIDYEKRTVTLKGPERTITMQVDESARNFDQAKVGDKVTVEFYESLALMVQRTDASAPPPTDIAAVELAPLGDKPGVAAVDTQLITATVEAIDYETRMVTLKGPQGNSITLEVDESAPNFDKVKVGDQVVARHTTAMAISVSAPTE